MALVEMKCPNCGAPMRGEGSCFVCSHCGTSVLNVIDAKIDSDVTIMSAEEFAAKLEEGKKSFVINVNDRFEEFDVDTMVINKKIKDAGEALERGEYDSVERLLSGVPRAKYFAVERLIFLASKCAKNEFGLTDCCGDIRDGKIIWIGREKVILYDRMIALADAETKRTYEQIRKYCIEKGKVLNEINEINKLFEVKLFDEAVTYAKKMCQTYPQAAYAWKMLYKAKRKVDPGYAGVDEFEKAKKCPDYLGNPIKGTETADKRARRTEELNKTTSRKNKSIAIAAAFLFVIPIALAILIFIGLYQVMWLDGEEVLYIIFCVVIGIIACSPGVCYISSKEQKGEIERPSVFTQANYIETFFGEI